MSSKDLEKQRKYSREWVAKRRESFFEDKSCINCGTNSELELDHIDPSQKVSHNIWSWSEEKRNEELAKCQVLCHACHKDKTRRQNGWKKHKPGCSKRSSRGWRCKCPTVF